VGSGPFPTEILNEKGKLILKKGNEFGSTTGRPRRCGWFDGVAVSYSCRLNGIDRIALTKPDVLDGFEEISVCVGYKYKGERLPSFPNENWVLEKVIPLYKKVRGWKKSIACSTDLSSAPQAFKDYLHLIEDLIQAKISIVSTGVERRDTILIKQNLKGLIDLEKVKADL
jgi:adenylosuccinate synthase